MLPLAISMLLAPAGLSFAQSATHTWELTASAGVRFREESGRTLHGAALSAGFLTPASDRLRWQLMLGISQLTASRAIVTPGLGPINQDSRETSFEAGALAELTLARSGGWSLVGGAGPVASLSSGCSNEGTSASDLGTGGTICINSFARSGTMRVGGEVEMLSEWRGARAAFEVGVSLAAHTIAAGETVSPAFFVGFRSPIL